MKGRFPNLSWPRIAALHGAALIALLPAPATAQDGDRTAQQPPAVIFTIGGGAKAYPRFPGAKELGLHHMLIVYSRLEGRPVPFRAPDQKFGLPLLAKGAVKSGLALNLQARRRAEDVGAAVGNVGRTLEAGGFLEAYVNRNLRLRTEVRQGINGHEGLLGDLGADLFLRDGDLSTFSIGPRVRWANHRYMNAYYGVTPAIAETTGLTALEPEGGIHAVGAAAAMRLDIGRGVAIHAHGIYDRLQNDAANSPIVARFGSRDQFVAGLGLSFSFRVPMQSPRIPATTVR